MGLGSVKIERLCIAEFIIPFLQVHFCVYSLQTLAVWSYGSGCLNNSAGEVQDFRLSYGRSSSLRVFEELG